jgi:hypothetical protein
MTISKSSIETEIFTLIHDRIESNVTSVTNTDTSTQTIQTYTSSFPDKQIDTKTSYPICVINPIEMNWTDFTLTKKQVNGTFSIDIYTTKSESADRFRQKIIDSIETYRRTLKQNGMDRVNLESSTNDEANRGGFKVHLRSCNFSFNYKMNKTIC